MLKKVFGAAVLLAAAFAAVFFLTRPPAPFDPAELALAPEVSPYPGDASLTCEIASQPNSLSIVFSNETDQDFYHGDPPDFQRLDAKLEGRWYTVPVKPYATAGVGTQTGPGEVFIYDPLLEAGYGTLPDGQYRLCFGFWSCSVSKKGREPDGVLYAYFDVLDGKFLPGTASP